MDATLEDIRSGRWADALKAAHNPTPGERSAAADRKAFAADGQLIALMGLIENGPEWHRVPAALRDIGRCVNNRARTDPDGLTDEALVLIVGLATELLARCRLVITGELSRADEFNHGEAHLPPDLIDGGWLDRFQASAKFVAQMAALRARLNHLRRLASDSNENDGESGSPDAPRIVRPMGDDPEQDAGGQAAAGPCWQCVQTA